MRYGSGARFLYSAEHMKFCNFCLKEHGSIALLIYTLMHRRASVRQPPLLPILFSSAPVFSLPHLDYMSKKIHDRGRAAAPKLSREIVKFGRGKGPPATALLARGDNVNGEE